MAAVALPHPARGDRRRTVITPEGVPLSFVLASRASRLGGFLLDTMFQIVIMALTTAALLWLAQAMALDARALATKATPLGYAIQFLLIVWFLAMFLFRHGYFLYFELGPRGATPGKRLVGARVASRDGGRLTTEAVIARNLIRDIELFMPLLLLAQAWAQGTDAGLAGWAGALWLMTIALLPCFNRDRLRAGDIIAGTWVVEAPRQRLEAAMSVGGAAQGQSATTGATYRFGEAELAAYGEYELQVLERVLRENRPEALREVAGAIAAKIGWDAGHGDERAFLHAYYTQLRARLERGMRFGQRKADKHSLPG